MMECFVCGGKCQFDKVSFTTSGIEVKYISHEEDGKKLRLCPKCMRMLYLASIVASRGGKYLYPDGAFVEEETE